MQCSIYRRLHYRYHVPLTVVVTILLSLFINGAVLSNYWFNYNAELIELYEQHNEQDHNESKENENDEDADEFIHLVGNYNIMNRLPNKFLQQEKTNRNRLFPKITTPPPEPSSHPTV